MQILLEVTLNKADKYNLLCNYITVGLSIEILLNKTEQYK